MIANLPTTEKEALFGLLDEYFASRPHRLPPTAAPAARVGLTDRATAAAGNAAGAAASVAVSNALRDQLARTGLTKAPPPPAPTAKKPAFNNPSGLLSSKTPTSPPPAPAPVSTSSTTLPPPTRTGASVPAASPAPAAHAAQTLPPGTIGSAQVLYDYGDGTDADDLQASEGEQIWLTERISDDWWRATSHDHARHGIIPATYVRQL